METVIKKGKNEMNYSEILRSGGVIAYPTEAVYGLGCDPWNEKALQRILTLKKRPVEKGVLLIAASFSQIADLIVFPTRWEEMQKYAENHNVTWIFKTQKNKIPAWISGKNENTVAIRITKHQIAKDLASSFGKPIVSTSANVANFPPAKTIAELQKYFGDQLDAIVPGALGNSLTTSEIIDAESFVRLR